MAGRKARETFGAVRRLPSKRVQASYIGPDRQRHTAPSTFENLGAARVWLAGVQTAIASGVWIAPDVVEAAQASAAAARKASETTFAAFSERWLATRYTKGGRPLRPSTLAEYRRLLRVPLASFADMPLHTITRTVVKDWHAEQLSHGTITQTARSYAVLSTILRDAVERGLLAESPCSIRGASSATTGKEVRQPTPAELAIIMTTIRKPYDSLVLVAGWSGLRFGELTELRGKDVTVDGDIVVLNVARAVTHTTATGAVVGVPKTSDGIRSVALPAFCTDAVLSRVRGDDDLLWHSPTSADRHLRQSTLNKAWQPARAAAGRPDLPWHGLRHYAASEFAAVGASEAEVMARLGQKSPGISRRYVHTTGRERDLLALLRDSLG